MLDGLDNDAIVVLTSIIALAWAMVVTVIIVLLNR